MLHYEIELYLIIFFILKYINYLIISFSSQNVQI